MAQAVLVTVYLHALLVDLLGQVLECLGAIRIHAPSRAPVEDPIVLADAIPYVYSGFPHMKPCSVVPTTPDQNSENATESSTGGGTRRYVSEINGPIHHQVCI